MIGFVGLYGFAMILVAIVHCFANLTVHPWYLCVFYTTMFDRCMGIGNVTEQVIPHEYCTVNIAFIFDNVPRYMSRMKVLALKDVYDRAVFNCSRGSLFHT
jgi:hypothetical protein